MGQNEKTSKVVATIASNALRTGQATPAQIKKLAASVLTQTPDKKKGKK